MAKFGNFAKFIRQRAYGARLELLAHRLVKGLDHVAGPAPTPASGRITLVCQPREHFDDWRGFTDYYQALGVARFFLLDRTGDDALIEWARSEPNVSVFRARSSLSRQQDGFALSGLLGRHALDSWCVFANPGEYIVYPFMETRSLHALTTFLAEERRSVFHAVAIDGYKGPTNGENRTDLPAALRAPFDSAPCFDADGYIQQPGLRGRIRIIGGPMLRIRHRHSPDSAPALDRIAMVRWQPGFQFLDCDQGMFPMKLNYAHSPGLVSPTGALYRIGVAERLADHEAEPLYVPGISVEYRTSRTLLERDLICAGRWF